MNIKKNGMTTAELLIASTIAVLVIGGILMLTEFSQRLWKNERAKSNLVDKLQIAMERMQKEIRSTDANQIFYYPTGNASYTAVSFPLVSDSDGDNFVDVTTDTPPAIQWGKTVIYHTYANSATGKTELRRTIFSPRQTLTSTQRQSQLNDVVQNGIPKLTTSPEYSSWNQATGTRVLCDSNSLVLAITPSVRQFDGFALSTTKSENVDFGSIRLAPGPHTLTFNVIGKNSSPSCTGYRLGIDSFSVTPSGCQVEAEEAPIKTDSGKAKVDEDMSAYGSWNSNRQFEYRATGVGDFISFDFYYDGWKETNFEYSLPYYTLREYGSMTGDGTEISGNSNYAARLSGCGSSWSAVKETGQTTKSKASFQTSPDGLNIRNVISSQFIAIEGRAIKVTFDNTKNLQKLKIDYACIMARNSGPDGDATTVKQITFGGLPDVEIAAGSALASDWIDMFDAINNKFFEKSRSYLLTFHVVKPGNQDITSWVAPVADTLDDHSYTLLSTAALASTGTWTGQPFTRDDNSYGVDLIDTSYFSNGTMTSQIYDTGMTAPAYSTLSWNIAKNNYGDYEAIPEGLGANLVIRVRSGNDLDALKAPYNWLTAPVSIKTKSAVSGSASINGIGNGRYVQFQGEFISQPSSGASDFLKSCVLKDVSISWPGETRLVDISGYFTRRPDYGIFSIKVDGFDLIKGIEVKLAMTETTYGGVALSKELTAEAQPRNTGK